MATIRQKRLARKIPEIIAGNKDITAGELVRSAGYSADSQRKPGEILNSKGVQEELANIGFTEEKAKEVVAVILGDTKEKADTRLRAADMVFKVHGTYAPEKSINVNLEARLS